MNGRKLHLEYAKSKGIDAVSFIDRKTDNCCEILTYRDTNGERGIFTYNAQGMIYWIIRNCKVELK